MVWSVLLVAQPKAADGQQHQNGNGQAGEGMSFQPLEDVNNVLVQRSRRRRSRHSTVER